MKIFNIYSNFQQIGNGRELPKPKKGLSGQSKSQASWGNTGLPLSSTGNKTSISTLPLLFDNIPEVLVSAIRQEKEKT